MLLDRLLRFLHKPKKHEENAIQPGAAPEAPTMYAGHGIFANATNFTLNNPVMVDQSQVNYMSIQTIYNTIVTGTAVLDRLLPYTCPDAATDALVRSPPPRCLPGTRERTLGILSNWLISHLWMIFWITGPAGAGKSAVAQSFAEKCFEQGRLGAAYFFIRSSPSHHPRTLIPSLAYQLAVNVPGFQNVLGHAILHDPSIFHKALQVQIQKLIVEPFTILQARKPEIAQNPFFIIIDGLDECQGVKAQCEIVEMIGEVVRLKKDLPLRWLIASRPELHLQYTFSQPDFAINYHRELLLIDADTKQDVKLFLCHDFENVRIKSSIKAPWPSEVDLRRLEDIASGLFIFAATIVCYVSDVEYGNPQRRLQDLFAFIDNEDRTTTTNPLETLDQLYSQILSEIPEDVYPITKRIISLHVFGMIAGHAVRTCSCLLRIDPDVFCDAVKKLPSIFAVSTHDIDRLIHPHHASFREYIRSRPRSGKFYISDNDIGKSLSKDFLFWYKTMMKDPRWISDDSYNSILESARNTVLPGVIGDNILTSHVIRRAVSDLLWTSLAAMHSELSAGLFDGLEDFDFRYMLVSKLGMQSFSVIAQCWSPHTDLVHTTPHDKLEETLLDKAVSEVGRPMEPAVFPIATMGNSNCPYRYIFIGHSIRCCLFWFDEKCELSGRCRLSCKVPPKEMYVVSDCVIHLPELVTVGFV